MSNTHKKMIKFLEDCVGINTHVCTPEQWSEIRAAAPEAGLILSDLCGNTAHSQRPVLSISGGMLCAWGQTAKNQLDPDDLLQALRIEALCKKDPRLKEYIKKADALGIRPGVRAKSMGSDFTVPGYDKWKWNTNSYAWCSQDGAPLGGVWIVGARHCTPITTPHDDDVIRVGDLVERIAEENFSMVKGDRATVTKLDSDNIHVGLDKYAGLHSKNNLIKIKAGGPVSTTNNQTHGQVHRESEGQGIGCGEGQAIRAGSSKGRIAVGQPPAGNALQARTGAGRIAGSQVLHVPLRSSHL